MKNRNSKSFSVTLCAAILLHAGALALIPDVSRQTEEKPAKTPVQVTLSFPMEAPELPAEVPMPPPSSPSTLSNPEPAEIQEPPSSAPPPPEPAVAEPRTELDSVEEPEGARFSRVEGDMAEETEQARGSPAESPALLTGAATGTLGAFDPKARANMLLQYESRIRLLIDRQKEYPYQARRQDQEGTVEIRFVLSRKGQLMEEPVLGTRTRYRLLNSAALEAVKKAVPYPPFPPEFPEEKMTFSITLAFSLTGNTF
ncbi:MAG: TonB family protein [Treponema sp.]|jgi:protein TonB|nr:TonB family protein [Treponema sp.]